MTPNESPGSPDHPLDMIVAELLDNGAGMGQPDGEYAEAVAFGGGRYLVGESLGEGAMGRVHRAFDTVEGIEVAVKILHARHLEDHSLMERFHSEASLLEQCAHPGVVALNHQGVDPAEGLPYFSMELMESSLEPWLGKPLRLERVTDWMRRICGAVSHAHSLGISHGDLKPSNLLLEKNGIVVKISDFSLARVGSAEDGPPGVNEDIRALGEVFYLLLTGREARMHSPPPSKVAGRPRLCDHICERAASERDGRRFATVREMDDALEKLQQRIGRPDCKAWWITAAAAAAVLVTWGGAKWWPRPEPPPSAHGKSATLPDRPAWRALEALPPAAAPAAATREHPYQAGNGMRFLPVPGRKGVLLAATEIRRKDFAPFVASVPPGDRRRLFPSVRQIELSNPDQPGRTWADTCPNEDDAAAGISWLAADAWCRWLTANELAVGRLPQGALYRLPWAIEWLTASGVDIAALSNKPWPLDPWRPWGGTWPPPPETGNFPGVETAEDPRRPPDWAILNRRDAFPRVAPVGCFPPNAAGFLDMLGNLSEWLRDQPVFPEHPRPARLLLGSNWMQLGSLERPLEPAYDYEISAVDARGFRPILQFAPMTEALPHTTLQAVSDISGTAHTENPGRPLKSAPVGRTVRVTWRVENVGGSGAGYELRCNAAPGGTGGKTLYRSPSSPDRPALGGAISLRGEIPPGHVAYFSFDMDTTGWPAGPVRVSSDLHEFPPAGPCVESSSPGAGLSWVPPDWWTDAFTLTEP